MIVECVRARASEAPQVAHACPRGGCHLARVAHSQYRHACPKATRAETRPRRFRAAWNGLSNLRAGYGPRSARSIGYARVPPALRRLTSQPEQRSRGFLTVRLRRQASGCRLRAAAVCKQCEDRKQADDGDQGSFTMEKGLELFHGRILLSCFYGCIITQKD